MKTQRTGFSLIEILAVLLIVGILMSVFTGIVLVAEDAARRSSTEVSIKRIHGILASKYAALGRARLQFDPEPTDAQRRSQQYAMNEVLLRRDFIRMNMPCRNQEIVEGPIPVDGMTVADPEIRAIYQKISDDYTPAPGQTPGLTPSEVLYLVVTLGCGASTQGLKVGDAVVEVPEENKTYQPNGQQEFLDGWGRPIRFLRWAPGFTSVSDMQKPDAENHHDPLDPLHADKHAYQLFPLIYSAGADGKYGLMEHGASEVSLNINFNAGDGDLVGQPIEDGGYEDNITNHTAH